MVWAPPLSILRSAAFAARCITSHHVSIGCRMMLLLLPVSSCQLLGVLALRLRCTRRWQPLGFGLNA